MPDAEGYLSDEDAATEPAKTDEALLQEEHIETNYPEMKTLTDEANRLHDNLVHRYYKYQPVFVSGL